MTSIPPPEGLNESDYEAIEAAVTETVRGRWFLAEFARRNRSGEMRQLLEAIARLETNVLAGQQQAALPSADPSVRLLIQRIKEISGQLDGLVGDMRDAGVDERFAEAVGQQARAVSGMMRNGSPTLASPAKPAAAPSPATMPPRAAPRLPRANLPANMMPPRGVPEPQDRLPQDLEPQDRQPQDPRLAVLSGLDGLPMAEKLALFS